MVMYVSMLLSVCRTLSFPSYVYKSVLYISVSTAALQIGSSAPSSQIPVCVCECVCVCVCVLTYDIYFHLSDLLHSV